MAFGELVMVWATAANAADLEATLASAAADGTHAVAGAVLRSDGVEQRFAGGADGATRFEIGSVTKVYTALLLADAAVRGELTLEDPASRWLPAGTNFAGGDPVTLAELASHSAGLPSLPPGWKGQVRRQLEDPWRGFEADDLFAAAARTRPRHGKHGYSNFGSALLGQLVARAADATYDDLLRDRVLGPLGLDGTGIDGTLGLATGHDARGREVGPWSFTGFAPAGALESTLDDQVRWISAWLAPPADLERAMALTQVVHAEPGGMSDVGLGWSLQRAGDRFVVAWHNGGTGGFSSFEAFEPVSGIGVVLLSARADGRGSDLTALGLQLVGTELSRWAANP